MKNPPELRYDPHLTLVLFPAGGTRQDGSHTVFFFDSWDVSRHVRCQGWLQRDLWRGWSTCLTFRDFRISKFSCFFSLQRSFERKRYSTSILDTFPFFCKFLPETNWFLPVQKILPNETWCLTGYLFPFEDSFFSKSNWTGNFATWFGTTWGYHFGIDLRAFVMRKVGLAICYGLGQVSFNGFSCPKTTTGFSKSLDWFEIFTWVVSTGNLPQVVIDSPWKRAQARPFGTLMVCDGFCHSVPMWLYMHKNMYAHIRTYTHSLHLLLRILVSEDACIYVMFSTFKHRCV